MKNKIKLLISKIRMFNEEYALTACLAPYPVGIISTGKKNDKEKQKRNSKIVQDTDTKS